MTVTSTEQLEAALRSKMKSAMEAVRSKVEAQSEGNVWEFYTEGTPLPPEKGGYVRTGALGNTAETTGVQNIGNSSSFEVRLNDNYSYSTGGFSANEVIEAAEKHTAGILGKPGFWEKTQEDSQKILDETMNAAFK